MLTEDRFRHSRAEVADLLHGIRNLLGKAAADQGLGEPECLALGTAVDRAVDMLAADAPETAR